MPPRLFTIGHGTRPIERFIGLLERSGIRRLVDVRSFPGSRRNPHFGRNALASALGGAGIAYEWFRDLGGFREARADSPHIALPAGGFRGYADHMDTAEFREALTRLIESSRLVTAVMCAESDWRRCHRRYLADALVVEGCVVEHVEDTGTTQHAVSPKARVVDGNRLRYDAGGQRELSIEG